MFPLKAVPIKGRSKLTCDYGCGNQAKFMIGKRACCSSNHSSCDARKKLKSQQNTGANNPFFGKRHTTASKRKLSASRSGQPAWNKGQARPQNVRDKISATRIARGIAVGPDNPNWRGGHKHYAKAWRDAVLQRDDYTCRRCGVKAIGKLLHTHHIKARRKFPELKYVVSNGETLCATCHIKYERSIQPKKPTAQ